MIGSLLNGVCVIMTKRPVFGRSNSNNVYKNPRHFSENILMEQNIHVTTLNLLSIVFYRWGGGG